MTKVFCNFSRKDGYASNCLQEVEDSQINKVYFDSFLYYFLCDNCLQIAPKWSEQPRRSVTIADNNNPDKKALFYYLQEHAPGHTIRELLSMIKEHLEIEISQHGLRNFCDRYSINFRRANIDRRN